MHLSVNGHFVFRVFDINNDGAISLKELKRIVKNLFHLINEKVNLLFVKKNPLNLFNKCSKSDSRIFFIKNN